MVGGKPYRSEAALLVSIGMGGGGKGEARPAGLEPALRVPANRGAGEVDGLTPAPVVGAGSTLAVSEGFKFSFSFLRVSAVQLEGAAAISARLFENSAGDMEYSFSGVLVASGSVWLLLPIMNRGRGKLPWLKLRSWNETVSSDDDGIDFLIL